VGTPIHPREGGGLSKISRKHWTAYWGLVFIGAVAVAGVVILGRALWGWL
jgi:hypothetical protein